MFRDVNKVMLIGNVVREPELRYTTSGHAILKFSIATNRNYKSNDEWQKAVSFHDVSLWNDAEAVSKRLIKGTRVYVEGRIEYSSWQGKDGQKKYRTEIVADYVSLQSRYSEVAGEASQGEGPQSEDINPDDLPF